MFEIKKRFRFEAGHVLPHHNGKCSQPHGHSYTLEVLLRSDELVSSGPQTNMITDFDEISAVVKPMINEFLDHKWINNTLQTDSPTVEFMAKWIYDFLKPKLKLLHAVTVHETPTSQATYWPL